MTGRASFDQLLLNYSLIMPSTYMLTSNRVTSRTIKWYIRIKWSDHPIWINVYKHDPHSWYTKLIAKLEDNSKVWPSLRKLFLLVVRSSDVFVQSWWRKIHYQAKLNDLYFVSPYPLLVGQVQTTYRMTHQSLYIDWLSWKAYIGEIATANWLLSDWDTIS